MHILYACPTAGSEMTSYASAGQRGVFFWPLFTQAPAILVELTKAELLFLGQLDARTCTSGPGLCAHHHPRVEFSWARMVVDEGGV